MLKHSERDRDCDGDQPFLIHLKDPEGDPVFTIEGHSTVDRRDATRPPARSHLILPMENGSRSF